MSTVDGVAALVLAAGRSSRMPGASKLVRPFGSSTVVARVAETAISAGLEPVVVVIGHEGSRIASCLDGLGVVLIRNPEYPSGRTTSLQAGLRALAERAASAAVVLLGDEPGVTGDAILRVVRQWRSTGMPILRVRYRDRPGHPVLLDRAVFSPALGLAAGDDAWSRLSSGWQTGEVRIADRAPVDVDRPEDLAAARERRLR